MMLWQATPASLWQGRDDSAEAPNALRLFQTIARAAARLAWQIAHWWQ